MPILENFHHFGGTHWETAALKNTLAYSGVTSPHTGKPLSEALCLGIGGGIAAGYSFCPSIPAWETKLGPPPQTLPAGASDEEKYMQQFRCGSGISVVGKYHAFSTGADRYDIPLKRLGCKTTIKESTGPKAAHQHLLDALASGRPAFLWTAAMKLTWLGWAGTCGMYSTVCFGIDEAKGQAFVSDRGATAITIPVDELMFLRNRVCSFKNRLLTFEPPKKLDEKMLKSAVNDGLAACAADFKKPKLGTFNLPGLLEWSKVIANPKNKKGWLMVYPGGRLYLPLRDAFDSIETAGTGGGLMRSMYANFLDEAAMILNRPALHSAAKTYRELASQWTALAEACLPDSIKPFKQTKALLRKRNALFAGKGAKGEKEIAKVAADLYTIEKQMREALPLGANDAKAMLQSLATQIAALHKAETEASAALEPK